MESTSIDNHAPIATDQNLATTLNTHVDIILSASDEDNDELSGKIESFPSHGILSKVNQDTGIVQYMPHSGFIGSDSFTFSVKYGFVDSIKATVTIRVNEVSGLTHNSQ